MHPVEVLLVLLVLLLLLLVLDNLVEVVDIPVVDSPVEVVDNSVEVDFGIDCCRKEERIDWMVGRSDFVVFPRLLGDWLRWCPRFKIEIKISYSNGASCL